MRSVAFLFSSGRRQRLTNGGPGEFLYGFAELARAGKPVAMFEEDDLGFGKPWPRLLEAASARVSHAAGVSPRLLPRLRSAIAGPLSPYDVLVATTQSIGMAIATLRAMGQHDKRLILMTMGLVSPDASAWRRSLARKLLAGVDLAVLSRPEAASIRSWVGDRSRVHDFVFGVDVGFWTPGGTGAVSEEVLSIGNDPARDFATLVAAWRPEFPRLSIITSQSFFTDKPNVCVERGDWRQAAMTDEDVRERFRRARLVITPVIDTIQPSGQSATLQAMACGRPVIMTRNRGLWDPEFMNEGVCRLVPPGDVDALSHVIRSLLDDRAAAERMGTAARQAVVAHDVTSAGMARQIERLAG
ncbi:glycosyltransferase [Hyphomicrobium sp.]|uniref:glycosyltransferase n=1 Tax=Hyphomicrobium sp. TaxID=82 RepID=UPI0025BD5262|nr:glycosyltransferase [Hyphomicrobium sp.]MCC7250937.1 glycosyltransferase family 4 protein [Hyphomicrobium sp.]